MEQQLDTPQSIQENQPEITVRPLPRWQRLLRSPLPVLVAAFALALGMWMVDFQPVSSDSTKLNAAYEPTVSDSELLNLKSPVWSEDRKNSLSKETDANGNPTGKLSTTVVPLSAQYIAPEQGGSILQLRARAAFNDKTMAVLVQWQDNTKNVFSEVGKNIYTDSVAVEFPLILLPGHQPFRCMGQPDSQVNIWQWKAERDPGVAGDSRIVTGSGKAVKNYVGPGIGFLQDTANLDPDSSASYDEATHTWSVIFSRPLSLGDNKTAAQFNPGDATTIAFAVWDGGNGERLSKKAVSTWVDFVLQPGNTTTQTIINFATIGGIGLVGLIAIVIAWRVLPAPKKPAAA
ncbi:MAG TPA: ethylbenzene dehydrogenase-related protein [Chloroflexia bacterium]|nr:ethylbenzene dehydrogenase-related protein [Chloroflexia bacterium]